MRMTHDGNDTSHNDWDGTLHHKIRTQDGHGGNSYTRLGRSVPVIISNHPSHVRTKGKRGENRGQTNAAPIQVKTMAAVQPMAPKKGA